jgi:hypothetical protein
LSLISQKYDLVYPGVKKAPDPGSGAATLGSTLLLLTSGLNSYSFWFKIDKNQNLHPRSENRIAE